MSKYYLKLLQIRIQVKLLVIWTYLKTLPQNVCYRKKIFLSKITASPVTTEVSITTLAPLNTSESTTGTAPRELEFFVTPQTTEAELGASVNLACQTVEAVTDCQWSWQPLPPTNLPSPNTDSQAKNLICEFWQALSLNFLHFYF